MPIPDIGDYRMFGSDGETAKSDQDHLADFLLQAFLSGPGFIKSDQGRKSQGQKISSG